MYSYKQPNSHQANRSVVKKGKNKHYSPQHQKVSQLLTRPLTNTVTTTSSGEKHLDIPAKNNLQHSFQKDFSQVKIHTDSTKAKKVGSKAFTQGSEICFSPGFFNPYSPKGRQLIAHELTHVIQQRKNSVRPTNYYLGNRVNDNTQLEKEADHMGLLAYKTKFSDELITLLLNRTTNSTQSKTYSLDQPLQKDEDDAGGFDIDYSLLPPGLQLRLWVLSLDANTSRVRLSRDFGSISAGLNYNYGGALSTDISTGGFRGSLGVDPSNANLSLGGSFGGFNFGASGNIGQRSFGLNLGYGSSLLPFPSQLSSIFNTGAQSLGNMAGNISAVPDNPLAWYDLHSDDISTITSAVNMGRRIHSQQTSTQNFGAGLRLSYSPEAGFTIYGGIQLIF